MTEVISFKITADEQASKKFDKLRSSMKGGLSVVKTLTKSVTAAAGAVLALNVVVNKGIVTQDNFAKRVGVSVDELSRLQFAANQAGISTETYNMATQRMIRRSAEAAKGLGEAQGALRDLGIDAKEFNQLGLEDKMNVLAKEMGDVSDESERLRLAFKLFDSEGTSVLQMLGENGAAMRAAANDADFLGVTISRQAAAQAQVFGEKMGRATAALKGLSMEIVSETSPIIAGLADKFADLVASNRTGIGDFVKNTIVGTVTVGVAFGQMFDNLKTRFTTFEGFEDFLTDVKSFVIDIFNTFKALFPALKKLIITSVKAYLGIFKKWGENVKGVFSNIIENIKKGEFKKAFTEIDFSEFTFNIAKAGADGVKEIIENFRTIGGEAAPILGEGLAAAGGHALDALGVDLEAATEKAKVLIENISLFGATVGETTKAGLEEVNQFTQAFQENQSLFMEWLGGSSKQFVESLRTSTQAAVTNLSAGLAQAIVGGNSLLDAFKNVAKQLVASVIAAFIKMGVQRLVLSKLSGSAVAKEAVAESAKAVGLAGANMFASWAAAPWPISLGAPAAATAAIAGASASFATGAATGAALGSTIGIGGIAHGGLTHNASEQTMLIRQGERVVSPRQNQDLTDALAGGSLGGGVNVDSINITMFPNATNADDLLSMNTQELADKMQEAMLTALNDLDDRGVRPNFVERGA